MHESPCSKNRKATQNKNYIRTIALERSVAKTTGRLKVILQMADLHHWPDVILNTEIHKMFGSHNGFLSQSMHHGENTQIKLITMKKRSTIGLSYRHCQPVLKKTTR